jgi:hypothetical protein
VSVWLIVQEIKWLAVGHSRAQSITWMNWINRAEKAGRAFTVPPVTIAGSTWAIECDTRADALWLNAYLMDACGFLPSMLRVTTSRGDW